MTSVGEPIVLSISSRAENIEIAQLVCDSVCERIGLDQEEGYRVGLALREGVANAMKHGNQFDHTRYVEVRFMLVGSRLRIEIEDQGEGFDPTDVPDPRKPENLLKTSGRGLLFIDELVDSKEHRFEDGRGTTLVIEKVLGGGDSSGEGGDGDEEPGS